jgi:murein DD-endopeptidase MepM/ murein hydrolase activator NlpD
MFDRRGRFHPLWPFLILVGAGALMIQFGSIIFGNSKPIPQLRNVPAPAQVYTDLYNKAFSGAYLEESAESLRRALESLQQRQGYATAVAAQPPSATAVLPGSNTLTIGSKAEIIPDMLNHIGATFTSVDCAYWSAYKNCQHWGVDVQAPPLTPIHAPFDGTFLKCIEQPAGSAEEGTAFMYTLNDGIEVYMGHLTGVKCDRAAGSLVKAGEVLGTTQDHNSHTHVQLRDYTVQTDDSYDKLLDFLEYWKKHQ